MIVIANNNGEETRIAPKILINGFPKSGLHLTELMVTCMARPFVEKPWISTFKDSAWNTEFQDIEFIKQRFWCPIEDTYVKGHCGYTPELEKMFYDFKYGIIFVHRDLRDVAVSQAHHVVSDKEELIHPDKDLYKALPTHEDVLKAVITGLDKYPGLIERWEQFAGWLDARWVLKLRFEDIKDNLKNTAELMVRYAYGRAAQIKGLKVSLDGRGVDWMVDAMLKMSKRTDLSATFRKGTTQQWRKEFTPEVTKLFKERAGDWLIKMGYEKDNDW